MSLHAQEPPSGMAPKGQDVYLSTSEGVDRIEIALPDPEADPGMSTAAGTIAEVVRNDLHFSGLFRITDPALYHLVKEDASEDEPASLTNRRWRSIGAAYLLRSRLGGTDAELVLEAYLVDLVSGDEVLGRRYRSSSELVRAMAHHLADDVVNYFTGSRSVFNTHLVYASRRGQNQEIYTADYDGANERKLTETSSLNLSPAVSPDGTVVVFTSFVTGRPRLHLSDLRSGESRLLFDCPNLCQAADWAPSGDRLAFSMSVEANSEIFVLPRDAGEPVRLTDHPSIDVSPTWSPTGDEIAFVSDRAGRPQVYVMDRYGLNVRRLTYLFEQATEPAWSPQGDRIAYTGRVEGQNRICLLDLASREESCFPPTGARDESPAWSPDGAYIGYLAVGAGGSTLYLRRADGVGQAEPIFVRGEPRTPSWYR